MTQSHTLVSIPDDFYSEIQLEIDECPYDAVKLHLQRSIVSFCEKSHYWKENIGPILVIDARTEYDLPTSRSFAVCSVMDVSYIDENTGETVTLERCKTDDVTYRYWQDAPFTISFYPHDELTGKSIDVIAGLKPSLNGEKFTYSEFINIDFRDAVIAGAKALIYKVPRKPWTDLQQAQINDQIFNSGVSEALRRQARGYSTLPDKAVRKERRFY